MLFKSQIKKPNDLQVLTKVKGNSLEYMLLNDIVDFKAKSAQPQRLLLK